jgi:glycosyltransferase involved in cell wall biosynthesis
MVAIHRFARTWQRRIDGYLVSTEFFRRVFIEGGLPPEKLMVRPHCVLEDPGARSSADGGYALFVGRLATEKGVGLLLRAWEELKGIPLRIRGEGPLSTAVETFASTTDHTRTVQLVGRLSRSAMYDLMRGARVLIVPSVGLYETFALVVIEAFACGTPVIVSNLGATAELVADGQTGLHFDAGSHEDLARKVAWAWAHPRELEKMGRAGRRAYERRHSGEAGYTRLMEIYESVLRARS